MEYRKKCNVCGRIYCYDDSDIERNNANAAVAILGSISAIANAVGGSRYDMYESNKMADSASNKITDLSKCPYCGSRDIRDLTEKEARDYKDGLIGSGGATANNIQINTSASVDSLIQRGMLFLEDGEWKTANTYFENALDANPSCAKAYIGKMLVDLRLKTISELKEYTEPINDNPNYIKAMRFCSEEEKDEIYRYGKLIIDKIAYNKNLESYQTAIRYLATKDVSAINNAKSIFSSLRDFKDSASKVIECDETKYTIGTEMIKHPNLKDLSSGIAVLSELGNYKESIDLVSDAKKRFEVLKIEDEKAKAEQEKIAKKKRNKNFVIFSIVGVLAAIAYLVYVFILGPSINYNNGIKFMETGDYMQAYKCFSKAPNYKDSSIYLNDIIVRPVEMEYDHGAYSGKGSFSLKYSSDGLLTNYIMNNDNGSFSYDVKTDSYGRVVSCKFRDREPDVYEYNNEQIVVRGSAVGGSPAIREFDDKGNITRNNWTSPIDKSKIDDTYSITTKDKNGYATEKIMYEDGEKKANQTYSYSYDGSGLMTGIKFNHKPISEIGLKSNHSYVIKYEAVYAPGTSISSENLFRSVWMLIIGAYSND